MNPLPDNRKMSLSLHNAKVLIDMYGVDKLNIMRLTMHNKPNQSYNNQYIHDTKVYQFFMTMIDEQ